MAGPKSWCLFTAKAIIHQGKENFKIRGRKKPFLLGIAETNRIVGGAFLLWVPEHQPSSIPSKMLSGHTVFVIAGQLRKVQRVIFIPHPSQQKNTVQLSEGDPGHFVIVRASMVSAWADFNDEDDSGVVALPESIRTGGQQKLLPAPNSLPKLPIPSKPTLLGLAIPVMAALPPPQIQSPPSVSGVPPSVAIPQAPPSLKTRPLPPPSRRGRIQATIVTSETVPTESRR